MTKIGDEHIGVIKEIFDNTALGPMIREAKGYEMSIEWFEELKKKEYAYLSELGLGVFEFFDVCFNSETGAINAKILIYPIKNDYQFMILEEAKKVGFDQIGFNELMYQVIEPRIKVITKALYDFNKQAPPAIGVLGLQEDNNNVNRRIDSTSTIPESLNGELESSASEQQQGDIQHSIVNSSTDNATILHGSAPEHSTDLQSRKSNTNRKPKRQPVSKN